MAKLFLIHIIALLVFSGCVTEIINIQNIPEKYFLDNQLARVKSIPDINSGKKRSMFIYDRLAAEYKMREQKNQESESSQNLPPSPPVIQYVPPNPWTYIRASYDIIKVDNQSLFLKTNSNNFYLLVLQQPIPDLMSRTDIRILLNSSFWNRNSDAVMYGEGEICPVVRIYFIEGVEEMAAVKDQILGNPKKLFYEKKNRNI